MASPSISFSQVPSNKRVPGVYFEENVSNAIQGLTPAANSVVLLAQKTAAGSVAAKVPTKVFSDADAQLYFGAGSVAHLATRAALTANPNLDLTVMALDDNGTTKAVGSLGVTGICGSAGTISVFIGDSQIDVSMQAGWTAAQGATGIMGAIIANQANLPVTAGLTGANYVNLTARNAGTLGNQIPLTLAIQSGCTGMAFPVTEPTGGATDPLLGDYTVAATPLNVLAGSPYNIIASTLPDTTNMGSLKSFVEFQANAIEQKSVVATVAVTDQVDTYSNIKTLAGTTINSGRISMPYVSFASGNQMKALPYKLGASYAAVLASTTDPVVPYDNLVLVGQPTPNVADWFSTTQKEDLLNSGVAPLAVIPGNQLAIVRAISTYTLNAMGIPDPTLLDINTYRTLDYVRDQIRTRLSLRFQRAKLSARTPKAVRSQVLDVLSQLEQLEIVQNVAQWSSGVIVERDTSDATRLDIKIPTQIVTGLHVLAGVLNLIL